MGPEQFQRKAQSFSLDYWTIGVLVYSMASGRSPFNEESKEKTIDNIQNVAYTFPDHFSNELRNFIDSFLKKEPNQRMNLKEAMKHDFILK